MWIAGFVHASMSVEQGFLGSLMTSRIGGLGDVLYHATRLYGEYKGDVSEKLGVSCSVSVK